MKKTSSVLCVLGAAIVFALGLSSPAFSADAPPESRVVKFGVVDVEAIEQNSLMNKDITAQINTLRNKLSDEVKTEEASLRKANDDLQKQKVLLAPDAFEAEVKKFREREQNFQKSIQDRNDQFNRVRINVRNAFAQELNKALIDITKEQQFTLILRRSQVLTVADFLDITSYVLDRMNKNAPKYQIPADLTQTGAAAKGATAPAAKSGDTKKK
jgi:Skp family chaperone for outer membrane proteins